jgi:ankyrin repeat protein
MKTDSQKHSEYFNNIRSKLKNGKIHEERQDAKLMYLHDACQFGHIDIVKGLILAKVDVNSKFDAYQPLQVAISSNNPAIVDLLMAKRS